MDTRTEALAKFKAEFDRLSLSDQFKWGGEERRLRIVGETTRRAGMVLDLMAGRDLSPVEMWAMSASLFEQGRKLEAQALREAAHSLEFGALYQELLGATAPV